MGPISDTTACIDLLETSYVLESHLPAGGYQNLCGTYQDVNYGWFDNRKGYYADGLDVCNLAGNCLSRAFLQENNQQIRLYATLGVSGWVVSGGTFTQASQSLIQTQASTRGNRGTGLSPGSWTVGGGLKFNGADIDPTFKADFAVRSISDSVVCVDLKESSYVLESNLPAGGYQNICATYQNVNYGLFDNRKGYYAEGLNVCNLADDCLTRMFLQENNAQIRIYASLGLAAWVVSGGTFTQASQALIQTQASTRGDRGTGLSPGSWTVGGGLKFNGADIDPTFKADFAVRSISDSTVCVDLKESSYVLESNLPDGGYSNICATY